VRAFVESIHGGAIAAVKGDAASPVNSKARATESGA